MRPTNAWLTAPIVSSVGVAEALLDAADEDGSGVHEDDGASLLEDQTEDEEGATHELLELED